MDSLVTLLIFAALAVLSAWFKRKQNRADEFELGEGQQDRGPEQPPVVPPGKAAQWEQELRRLLGEEPTAPPPPLPRAEPRPVLFSPPPVQETIEEETRPSALLARATESQQRGINLQQRVALQLRQGSGNPAVLKISAQATGHDHAQTALQLLRQPRSLRAAVICSLILASPKAFEDEKTL